MSVDRLLGLFGYGLAAFVGLVVASFIYYCFEETIWLWLRPGWAMPRDERRRRDVLQKLHRIPMGAWKRGPAHHDDYFEAAAPSGVYVAIRRYRPGVDQYHVVTIDNSVNVQFEDTDSNRCVSLMCRIRRQIEKREAPRRRAEAKAELEAARQTERREDELIRRL
jgi:hypothetical protein